MEQEEVFEGLINQGSKMFGGKEFAEAMAKLLADKKASLGSAAAAD